jgi:cytidylate kinase
MKKINIAIDGHSSCGKSTIAKQLAQQFEYVYIDTGAMYRAVCLYCLQNDIMNEGVIDREALLSSLDDIEVSFQYNAQKNASETYLNGVNVESEIRGIWVSDHVSSISQVKEVREKMVAIQQQLGEAKGVVMDGRDIGTVVFPKAELKLFVTASLEERARRRHQELKEVSLEEVVNNLQKRDFDDSTRAENPLKQAEDAIVIDNTNLSKEAQMELIISYCEKAMQS